MRFFHLIFFFFHFRLRSWLSTRNNTPSSVESIIESICLFVYSFDVSSALRERESKREKNGEILVWGEKTLTFQSKEELLVDFSKACDLFFALSSCSCSSVLVLFARGLCR